MGVSDIEAIIRQWAQGQLDVVDALQQSRISSRNSTMTVDWSKVHFSTVSTTFSKPLDSQSPKSNVVFTSNYENRTKEIQDHTFSMDRKTDATVRTKVTKGFSRNGVVGINIVVPDVITNQTGSFGSDIVVANEDENVVKHSVSWGLNSTVKAQPGKRTIAELKITETEYGCTFDSQVQMQGRVVVRIRNGNSEEIMENSLASIIQQQSQQQNLRNDGFQGVQGRKVTWMLTGELRFKFGISQDVRVLSESL